MCAAGAALILALAGGMLGTPWWWLTNDQPPLLEAQVPSAPSRATIHSVVRVRTPSGVGEAALTGASIDGAALSLAAGRAEYDIPIDTTTLRDGAHVLRLEAVDTSRRRNRAAIELPLRTDNTPPSIAVDRTSEPQRAGQPVVVRVTVSEAAEVRAEWENEPLPLLPGPAGPLSRLGLIAVPPTHPGGRVVLAVHARDGAGNARDEQIGYSVEAVALPRQNLIVPPALAALATGPVASAEASQLDALTRAVRPERLWNGEFHQPLAMPAVRTTGFGDRRDYTDGYVAAHAGYDVAAPERTPVLAVAPGIVVFAGALQQRGTALVLDHGWGVYSVYGHLSELRVATGESVAQGQTVGLVGNTGLSTGPHLHWEIRLRGQPVDPDAWIALSRSLP